MICGVLQKIYDHNFTAKEESFDNTAEGKEEWTDMIVSFYKDFHPTVTDVAENAEREVGERASWDRCENRQPISRLKILVLWQ
jgi:DNA topoisomerase-1